MPNLGKSLILLMIFICIVMSVSCVSASDSTQTAEDELADEGRCEITLDMEEIEAAPLDGPCLAVNGADDTVDFGNTTESSAIEIPRTYNDLAHDIENLNPGDVYDIKRDYVIEDADSDLAKNRIVNINADNVVINGNGHTIDANGYNGYFAVFNVTGNNVTIVNLHIVNSRARNFEYSNSHWNSYGNGYSRVTSPIEWHGDNGVISCCRFDNNTGEDGGAICWLGNNGSIDNCYFDDNAAVRGGSIFVSGYNNTISSSIMEDSYSEYYESIFLKNFDEDGETMVLILNDCYFMEYRGYMEDSHVEGPCIIISDNEQIYPTVPAESYDELREIIENLKDGDVLNLTRDYYYDYDCCYYPIMANNVTINGNGHRIYGDIPPLQPLIWVLGDYITVNGLIFDFDGLSDTYGTSFVTWKGNNGVLTDCAFIGNYVHSGGAVTWTGNDGIIDRCLFVNNTASIAGGAIFISGENNRINNSMIFNCSSALTGDAIFIDHKRKNLTVEGVYFDNNAVPLIDMGAMKSNIEIGKIGGAGYCRWVGGEYYEISNLIYLSIMNGGIGYVNDEVSYYSCYYNESGDFVFTITKQYFQYNISYSQSYYFKNISDYDFNEVFNKLLDDDYETRFTMAKTAYINNASDYLSIFKILYSDSSVLPVVKEVAMDYENANNLAKSNPVTYALNVEFTKALTINCDSGWYLSSSIFSVVNINGAGSTIKASSKERDEDKWAVLSANMVFTASNLNIEGFNTVIENMGGQCIFQNVNFKNNKMDYMIDRDWGAAILNTGSVTCVNCSFINNYAKNGGAIFNQGLLTMQDCLFSGNEAYGEGNDICMGDGGKVIINGKLITGKGQSSNVHFTESMSLTASTLITVFSIAASFMVGTLVGFLTANPIAGTIAGAVVGAALGSACAGWIISEHFDVNYDRVRTAAILITGSAAAGAFGGLIGGYWGGQFAAAANWIAEAGGPEVAHVDFGYSWYHAVAGELVGSGFLGAVGGIVYYATELFSK